MGNATCFLFSEQAQERVCLVLLRVVLLQPSLGIESGHASSTSTGDGLAVFLVLNITGSENTGEVGLGGAGNGLDVTILVQVQLTLEQGGGGNVTDGIEQTVDIHGALLLGDSILELKGLEQLAITLALDGGSVVKDGDLGVVGKTVGHDLGGAKLVATDEDIDVGG